MLVNGGAVMTKKQKAVGCGDTQAAEQAICETDSKQSAKYWKAVFFRWVAWLSVLGGCLC